MVTREQVHFSHACEIFYRLFHFYCIFYFLFSHCYFISSPLTVHYSVATESLPDRGRVSRLPNGRDPCITPGASMRGRSRRAGDRASRTSGSASAMLGRAIPFYFSFYSFSLTIKEIPVVQCLFNEEGMYTAWLRGGREIRPLPCLLYRRWRAKGVSRRNTRGQARNRAYPIQRKFYRNQWRFIGGEENILFARQYWSWYVKLFNLKIIFLFSVPNLEIFKTLNISMNIYFILINLLAGYHLFRTEGLEQLTLRAETIEISPLFPS